MQCLHDVLLTDPNGELIAGKLTFSRNIVTIERIPRKIRRIKNVDVTVIYFANFLIGVEFDLREVETTTLYRFRRFFIIFFINYTKGMIAEYKYHVLELLLKRGTAVKSFFTETRRVSYLFVQHLVRP